MSKLDDTTRLKHMRDAAQEAIAFLGEHDHKALGSNRQLLLAIVKDIEIMGEAARQISLDRRQQSPNLPWQDIIGMRNRLVHAYFEIDVEIVWVIVTQDLPELLAHLERLLATVE